MRAELTLFQAGNPLVCIRQCRIRFLVGISAILVEILFFFYFWQEVSEKVTQIRARLFILFQSHKVPSTCITYNEGTEGEWTCSYVLSLTSARLFFENESCLT
jgi:hypothetical protein